MTPDLFVRIAVNPALDLFPEPWRSDEARAFILAIALQESELKHRRQFGGEFAHSYLQFELIGIEGVWTHESTKRTAREICRTLDIAQTPLGVWAAVEFHDILACAFARLLMRTLPQPLPVRGDTEISWNQYMVLWRPGRPRRVVWPSNVFHAWATVEACA